MKSFIAALRNLVLPFGRTSGQRIILNGDTGQIQVYDASNRLIAEMSPTIEGDGGVWSRGFQSSPYDLFSMLAGGEVRFSTVTDNILSVPGLLFFDTDGTSFTDLVLDSGAVNLTDKRAIIVLQSDAGSTPTVMVTGNGTNRCELDVDGTLTAGNIRTGSVQTPAPGASPAQTTASVTFAVPMTGGTPRVVLTPVSAASNLNTTNIRHAVTSQSASGFTVNCWRDTNFATNFDWIAVG